ncbi:MAG: hypothetical protein LAN62_19405 [Acidobacteriia bacterium]|nr:hypothetical protein [Terriglobia bacterium]
MIVAALILITSAALLVFYLQTLCERILRREFKQPYFKLIADANGLEFPTCRVALEENARRVKYERLRVALACDYRALAFLLRKVAGQGTHRSSFEDHLLLNYCRLLFFAMSLRHFLGLQVKPAALKLAKVLQYFANVVGYRVEVVRTGSVIVSA